MKHSFILCFVLFIITVNICAQIQQKRNLSFPQYIGNVLVRSNDRLLWNNEGNTEQCYIHRSPLSVLKGYKTLYPEIKKQKQLVYDYHVEKNYYIYWQLIRDTLFLKEIKPESPVISEADMKKTMEQFITVQTGIPCSNLLQTHGRLQATWFSGELYVKYEYVEGLNTSFKLTFKKGKLVKQETITPKK